MLNLKKLLSINSLLEKNKTNYTIKNKHTKFFDYLYSLVLNHSHAMLHRKILTVNFKTAKTVYGKFKALVAFYRVAFTENYNDIFQLDVKNALKRSKDKLLVIYNKEPKEPENVTFFSFLKSLSNLFTIERALYLVSIGEYAKAVFSTLAGYHAYKLHVEKQKAGKKLNDLTLSFLDNCLQTNKEITVLYQQTLNKFQELRNNANIINNSSTVVVEPDLVKFTPVTHAIFEKKTIYSPFSHPFHIVDPSPWPFCTSIALWFMALNTIAMVHSYIEFNIVTFLLGLLYLLFSLAGWWRDVIRESTYEFKHTPYVRRGLLLGMMLFIVSEVMFFFGFFWAFFHSSLVPSPAIGGVWPPVTIIVISPWKLPLVNTLLLLLSGVTLTISHRSLVYLPYYNQAEFVIDKIIGLIMLWLRRTIYLGVFFLFCQAFEYYFASFTFQDTVYGGTFYILTGLHGLHVLVGTIFLIVCLWRTSLLHFTVWKQVGFKSAVWYWHFVDVVWIFLYLVIYVWGNA
jgi:heme/copper-type cytochrome/quinol oxidase subunit 3